MKYKGARIQVLDLPGIIEGAANGQGRGKQVISTARTCNLILVILDAAKPVTHKKIMFGFGIRINQKPPEVKFLKKESGGIGYVKHSRLLFLPVYSTVAASNHLSLCGDCRGCRGDRPGEFG